MKRTKVVVAVAMAVLMVLAVANIGFAAGDIGGGAQAGKAESTVTMSMSETAPMSISATVPITIPLAIKVDATATGDAPVTYVPTDCKIINNSKDFAQPDGQQDIAIKIDDITATVAPGSTLWSLAETPANAYDLKLTLCGGTFGDLPVADGGIASVDAVGTAYQNIPGAAQTALSVAAEVGGTNADYTIPTGQDGVAADIFKVQFTISAA